MDHTERGRIITQPVDNSADQALQTQFHPVSQIMGYTERGRIITQPILRPVDNVHYFNQDNQGTNSYCYRRQYVPQPALL